MTKTTNSNHSNNKHLLAIPFLLVIMVLLIITAGCDKNNESGFTADFSFQYIDDNSIFFENKSEGEYYSMIWDFGNGQGDTTTNKKEEYNIFYSVAGDYEVSLRIMDYTGNSTIAKKTINISTTSLVLSFSAVVDPSNLNYVLLTNTSFGDFDSFSWLYRDMVIENEAEHLAYFPFAGNFDVELIANKGGDDFSLIQNVIISQDDPNYNPDLIWSDEFDYTGLPDPDKWNMETGGGGWGNNELQYYTDREENAVVGDGVLTITALEESYGGRDYTSARITTQNKFDVKYGKVEARIKLPYGQGIWPAFWMLGDNISSVGWPACGEIDIMEMVGGDNNGDNTVYSTLHWEHDGSHADYGESYMLSSGIFADDFHVFAIEWDEEEIRGYMDDYHYFTADIVPSQLSEFHNNFFLILNLAVGGNWPGSPDATTSFPQIMEIDYVRVYSQ